MFGHLTATSRRLIASAASGVLLAVPLIAATAPTVTAAAPSPVTIKVDFGASFMGSGYSQTYQVSNVTPGPGTELTGDTSERTNDSTNIPLPGLRVDVDPATQTVTVLPPAMTEYPGLELPPNFWPPVTDIKVDIVDVDMAGFAPVSDSLVGEHCFICGPDSAQLASAPRAGAPGDPSNTNVTRTITGGAGHWVTTWHTSSPTFLDGAAVFHYALPAPQVSTPKSFSFGTVGKPTGKPEVGNKLTAPALNLPAGTTETFQWYRVTNANGHSRVTARAIRGAHAKLYKLRKKDKGAKVFVRMRVSAPGYNAASVDSKRKRVH